MSLAVAPLTLHVDGGPAGAVGDGDGDGDGVGVGVGVSLGLGAGDDDGTGLLEEDGVGVGLLDSSLEEADALLADEEIGLLDEEALDDNKLDDVTGELVLKEVLDEVVICCFDVAVDDLLDVVDAWVDVLASQ
jgi:hypothetical protein